jgi:alpha-L-fucosidase
VKGFTRRRFLAASAAAAAWAVSGPGRAQSVQKDAAEVSLPHPTPAQLTWQDAEIGLLYSFDLAIAAGDRTGNNASRKTWDPALYNPAKLDTDQWLEAAKACGAGYAVFTATHFNGFMQWQSDLYPYGMKQARWRDGKGDVVGDFVASCRKAGILPGIYFSTHRNVYWQVWGHYVDWGKGRGTPEQEKFNRIAEKMTEELCSRYGPLVQIWFDAGVKTPAEGGPDVLPIFEKHQPGSVFYSSAQRADHRWIGNEQGFAGEPCWATMPGGEDGVSHNSPSWKPCLLKGDPDGRIWSPGMVDVPLRNAKGVHDWFWAPGHDRAVLPADTLMKMYNQSVGRNCNLVLGEVITAEGEVPACDIARLGEFGAALRKRFEHPIAETQGSGESVELSLPRPQRVGEVVLMEDIAQGERVREYRIEARTGGDTWQTVASGQSIGHKWIHRFAPVEAAALRVVVMQSTAAPVLRRFAAFAGA